MLTTRVALAVTAAALVFALHITLRSHATPVLQRADDLLGERWYRLALADEPLGYWHTRTFRDAEGNWVFESTQRSALNPEDPVTVSTRRVFGAIEPHPLLQASYRNQRRNSQESTLISHVDGAYLGRWQQGAAAGTERTLDLSYTLTDYLDYEIWLHEQAPPAGSLRAIRTLDFSRMAILPRQLQIVERNATGYLITNPAPQSATSIQLDASYSPQAIRLAGLFDLELTSAEQALAPGNALQAASYYVPVDQPLTDHTRIKQLELTIESDTPPEDIWEQSREQNGDWVLSLRANPLTTHADEGAIRGNLDYPTQHPAITQLARAATAGAATEAEMVSALVGYVHDYLRYDPDYKSQPVLSLLEDPVGDCTEFADLFTTLARSLGIPAITVFGLAYSEAGSPAFAFHAWNEVAIDGRWQAVDPTWNQLRVDATHIPLPLDETAAMKLLTGSIELAFELRDVEYFSD